MRKIFLFVAALLCSASVLFAQDTREIVTEVAFTTTAGDFNSYFVHGETWNGSKNSEIASAIQKPDGAPYRWNGVMANFWKWNGADWSGMDYGTIITEGKYQYYIQIRIDGAFGSTHRFPDDLQTVTVTVDGVQWNVTGGAVEDTYSYLGAESPDIEVVHVDVPFRYEFNNSLNYSKSFRGEAVEAKDLAEFAIGGTESYTFSKISNNVPWLNVTDAGIMSGTPTTLDENSHYDTIRVTDGVEADTFRILVGPVYPASAEREVISAMTFTGFTLPTIGQTVNKYEIWNSFQPAAGAPYYVSTVMSSFWKVDGLDWTEVQNGDVLTAGSYNIALQIRIDGTNGYYKVLDPGVTVTVNGNAWSTYSTTIDVGYSYTNAEYNFDLVPTALDETATDASAVKRIVNGQLLIEKNGKTFNAQGIEVK